MIINIMFFQDFYPDELVYSTLARMYVHSGVLSYAHFAEKVLINNKEKLNMELMNNLKDDIIQILTKNITLKEIILNHTMFPYYARFLSKEQKNNSFKLLMNMENKNNYTKLLMATNNNKYLKYCPICANNDRDEYGEAYWHRVHQIKCINICYYHHCKLINSNVPTKITKGILAPAETEIKDHDEIIISENNIKIEFTNYITEVFLSEINLKNNTKVGNYLKSKIRNTKYGSDRGERIKIKLLCNDMTKYYSTIIDDKHLIEPIQLAKTFRNLNNNIYMICLVGMFLKIPVKELLNMNIETLGKSIDEKIKYLHDFGYNYTEISKMLNISYNTIKFINKKNKSNSD